MNRVPPSQCPRCGEENDAAICMTEEGASPKPGDWTICFRCAATLQFGADLKLVLPYQPVTAEIACVRAAILKLETI